MIALNFQFFIGHFVFVIIEMFEKMLVQTNVYYGFLLEFRSLWRFKRWVNHCVKNWNGIEYFHRLLCVLTSLKIHIRKLLVVFFSHGAWCVISSVTWFSFLWLKDFCKIGSVLRIFWQTHHIMTTQPAA